MNNGKIKKQAVIFDLDGTLWDSSEEVTIAWNKALEKIPNLDKRITLEDMHNFMGKTLEVISKMMFPELDVSARANIMKECCKEEHKYIKEHGGHPYEGIIDMLDDLKKNYQIYIVSNCQDGYIQTFMKYHKLGKYFDDIEMAGRTGLSKGENIKLIMDRNHIDKAVYVGDTMGDFEAASYAGVPFIYAKYGFGTVDKAKYVANDIKEMPCLVNIIFKS